LVSAEFNRLIIDLMVVIYLFIKDSSIFYKLGALNTSVRGRVLTENYYVSSFFKLEFVHPTEFGTGGLL
jgi:hypothetical protein